MINISKSGNAIKFAFTDSDHYLDGNGEIEVPVNSLTLIVDESNMVTFRKANSNDIFLSFNPANSNLSDKAGVINFYKTEMVGSTGGGTESGITSGDVQTMIDNSLVDYYTDDEVDAALSGKQDTLRYYTEDSDGQAMMAVGNGYVEVYDNYAHMGVNNTNLVVMDTGVTINDEIVATQPYVSVSLSGKADTSAVTAVASDVSTLSGQVATKVATSDFNAYSATTDARLAEDEEVTAAALNNLDETKQNALEYYSEDTTVNTATIHIENTDDGTVGEVYVDGASVDISALRTEEDEDNGSMVETHSDINGNNAGIAMSYEKLVDDEEAAHSYLNVNEGLISMEVMANEETTNVDVYSTGVTINGDNVLTDGMITTAITSGSTDDEIPTAKAVYDAIPTGGGGMDDDTQQLISTALNDLNGRKADLTELLKYQKKGDYVKTPTLADYMTNDAFDEYATAKERIISGALNDLNDKFGGLRLVKLSQSEYDALPTKSNETLYIINNVI